MFYELFVWTNVSWFLFFITSLVVFVFLIIQNTKTPDDIPPGPRTWIPLFGNLLELAGDDPRIQFRILRKKYGDIYSLYLGSKLIIVINGYENIKEAFVKNADVFSERPDLYFFSGVFKKQGIVSSSGQLWRDHRKFALDSLRDLGFGKTSYESKIEEEIVPFLSCVEDSRGHCIDIRPILQISISNIVCNLTFGRRFRYDNEEFLHVLKLVAHNLKVLGSVSILNFYSVLRFIPFDPFKIEMVKRNTADIDTWFRTIIEDHKNNFDERNPVDFIDAYIKEMRKLRSNNPDTSFTDFQLIKVMEEFLVAGTDATTNILLWSFLFLMKFPAVQDRMRGEIDDIIGRNSPISLRDRTSLVYSEAVIMETLRLGNVAATGFPHGLSRDTHFHGYRLPKEAVVLGNIDSVFNDPFVWEDPEKFEPSRFIDKKGHLIKPVEFIPFSIGRRVCLGESLARMELFLFLTTIVQRFVVSPPEDGKLPRLRGVFGMLHHPEPYKLRLIPRSD